MADKRIDAHTNTTTVADVDEFIVDSGSNGTRNITYSNLKSQILGSTSIATIGNTVTEAIYNTYTDIGDLTQTGVTGATVAAQISQLNDEIDAINNNMDSLTVGRVMRYAVSVDPNHSAHITLSTDFSTDAEFALAAFNIGGNSLVGFALFALGQGTSKIKDLIGAMDSQYYTATYNTSTSTWVITNKAASAIKITVMLTKGSVTTV